MCFNCHEEAHFVEYVCTSCKTRLCIDCFPTHFSDEHITIPVEEFIGNKFPCLTCNASASFHCHSCNLDFCDECRVDHQANGLLEHDWIDIISHNFRLREVSAPMCCKCGIENGILAKSYCLTCDPAAPMCECCSKKHMQEFARHSLCHDISTFDDEWVEQEEFQSIRSKVKCMPCNFDGDDSDATAFCLTCKEPEPMCSQCAAQHTRERKTRGHEICNDIEKLRRPIAVSNMFCENCNVNGETSNAVAFCLSCEQPEPFCEDCAKIHVKQKAFRNHEISFGIQQLIKYIPCEPCSFENTENSATHFCLDCEEPEPLCKTCATQHLKQRSGRGHSLCEDISKLSGYEKAKFRISPR